MKKTLIVSVVFFFFTGCTQSTSPLIKTARPALGTIVEITVADQHKPRQSINRAIEKAFREIERVENLLSRFKKRSEISRINAHAHIRPTKVNLETINLLEKSIFFSQLTNGAFDITVYPLMEVWGLSGKDKKHIPEPDELREVLKSVGYQNIKIMKDEKSVFLAQPKMSLDLGGIAKGYAVDKAIAVLRQEGIESALVNAGGDIYALGKRDRTKKWHVGLQHPQKDAILAVLELEDKAVATSGDYQRYVEIDGKRYSHIINPKTGFPLETVPASVTVLANDCLSADALATSIFVLGQEKGISLVNQLEDYEAVVVNAQKDKLDILCSEGLKGKLKFSP